jgi:hypothetical protein
MVYKHWDGYPKAVYPWLRDFNIEFKKERGDDVQYKFAQLLRSSARDAKKYDLDDSEFTGWGVVACSEDKSDYGAEFQYILKLDGTVGVINTSTGKSLTATQLKKELNT